VEAIKTSFDAISSFLYLFVKATMSLCSKFPFMLGLILM